jgi:hypothetical protein
MQLKTEKFTRAELIKIAKDSKCANVELWEILMQWEAEGPWVEASEDDIELFDQLFEEGM